MQAAYIFMDHDDKQLRFGRVWWTLKKSAKGMDAMSGSTYPRFRYHTVTVSDLVSAYLSLRHPIHSLSMYVYMYQFTTLPHPHGRWQLQELLGNLCYKQYVFTRSQYSKHIDFTFEGGNTGDFQVDVSMRLLCTFESTPVFLFWPVSR